MKKTIKSILAITGLALILTSCGTLVEPNWGGVLMENYGKNGKSDFKEVSGRVSTWGWGTELYQVPLWEQRAQVDDSLHLQTADQNQFSALPKYSYKVMKGRLVDVIFDNKQLDSKSFLSSVESQILETRMYDIIKEQSRKHITDTLMAVSGSLKFEKECEALIKKEFESRGFELLTFSFQGKFSSKVMDKIDQRLQVNTNISVIDQQILEQKKINELEELRVELILIQNRVLTPEYLEKLKVEKWDGHYPTYYSGNGLPMINVNSKK